MPRKTGSCNDDTTYTPVVDDVSRHLAAARKAFDAKDNKKAATEMRAVADQLKLQTAMADKENLAAGKSGQGAHGNGYENLRTTLSSG